MDTATHLRLLLPLLPNNAAAACWARVFVLTHDGPLLRDSKLATPIAGKLESHMVNGGGVPSTACPVWSPLLDLQGGDLMYGEHDGPRDTGSLVLLTSWPAGPRELETNVCK